MKLLVTGGARFIGSHLAAGLCRLGRVRVLANFSTGSRENLADINPEPIDSAILDGDTVRRMEGIDPWPSRRGNGDRVEPPPACVAANVTGLLRRHAGLSFCADGNDEA